MQTLLPLLFLLLLFSCSSDDEMQQPMQPTLHRVTLHLDGQLSGFQDTRSTSYVWNDGAKLYLQLQRLAEAYGVSEDHLEQVTDQNVRRIFKI